MGIKRKRLECTISASVPAGMTAAHFRRLIADQLFPGLYLSIADQLEADTSAGSIRPRVSPASRQVR